MAPAAISDEQATAPEEHDKRQAASAWNTFIDSEDLAVVLQCFKAVVGTEDSSAGFCLGVGKDHIESLASRVKSRRWSWKEQSLFVKLAERASQSEYSSGSMNSLSILISGAGPSGLRAAIEAALHGAKVTIVELRTEFSRKNCLHLWPFMVEDLRSLHIKYFYPSFCSGAVEHVNIANLQMALLKVALLLGVEVHCDTSIKAVALMDQPMGTVIKLTRPVPQVEQRHYDVLLAAEGEHSNVLNLLKFERKHFHGGRSIGITCNFENKKTPADSSAEELAIATQYHQERFRRLHEQHGIELENITYYRDATHYFVMTATKQSLLERGVILRDGPGDIVGPDNISTEALVQFVYDVGSYFDRGFELKLCETKPGKPDVQIFDYSTKHVVCNPSKVIFPNSRSPLLVMAIGDAALAPFWPLGTGANRGTLMALDACWVLRSLDEQKKNGCIDYDALLREHERLFKIMKETMSENLKDYSQSVHAANSFKPKDGDQHFSVDPRTRYAFA